MRGNQKVTTLTSAAVIPLSAGMSSVPTEKLAAASVKDPAIKYNTIKKPND
jgi:hypothetical protein